MSSKSHKWAANIGINIQISNFNKKDSLEFDDRLRDFFGFLQIKYQKSSGK